MRSYSRREDTGLFHGFEPGASGEVLGRTSGLPLGLARTLRELREMRRSRQEARSLNAICDETTLQTDQGDAGNLEVLGDSRDARQAITSIVLNVDHQVI